MTAPAQLPQAMPPDPMAPRPYRVVSRRRETHDVVTLGLEPVHAPGSPMRPGQFNMIYAFGIGEVPISVSAGKTATFPTCVGALLQLSLSR